ncbi:MAG: phosphopantothenoylcysteine decarboxylase [Opitutaceae bacterium]
MKILVTAGATREPIDAVRFLSNVSTGTTGAALADELTSRGHPVVLLHGQGAVISERAAEREEFSSAADLQARLLRRLGDGDFDAIVMAAAVADYRPAQVIDGKLSSDASEQSLRLVRNEKILPLLKGFAPRPLRVIGFKLTVGAEPDARRQAVAAQFSAGGIDAVIHNDLVEIRRSPLHPFWLWQATDVSARELKGIPALAEALLELIARPSE